MEKIKKSAFCVIGMPGSTDDGEGFVQKLWEKANSRFGEVEALADRNEDGSLKGVWGIMTDMDFTYGPWTDDFTRGRYLAGVESRTDEIAPKGWKKWIVPGFEALKVKVENENTFRDTLKYMKENGITLGGAVHDFTDPATGENYMIFPTALDDSKRELIKSVKEKTDPFAPCGFHCTGCMFSDWCGNCLSTCNMCSYATISEDNICENVRCTKEKGLYACSECPELGTCMKGFFSDCYGCFARASSMFRRDHGKENYLKALNSVSKEEQQFLNDVKADPADKAAEAEAIRRVLEILESHIG